MAKKIHNLAPGTTVTTQMIPASIAPGEPGSHDSLLNMKNILRENLSDNPAAASICVTLAILESIEKSGAVPDPGTGFSKDHNFNWGQGGSEKTHESIAFAVHSLFFHDSDGDDLVEFKKFVQDKLLPRGLEILEEKNYEELCDWFEGIIFEES